ncbi:MAG: alpha/beta hydrolase [Alphaproteobacteria bacterium]|nr:alpha/beta hydrolase [Alphaproteobacteria bacterium]
MPFEKASQLSISIKGKPNQKPTLLFLHGAGMDKSVWQEQASLSDDGFQTLFLDLPGHGASKGQAATSIEDMAADIVRYVEESRFIKVCIIGHSMGALIALLCAASNSEKIVASVACGVSNLMPVHPSLLEAAKSDLPKAANMISKWSFGSKLSEKAEDLLAKRLEACRNLISKSPHGVLSNDLEACNNFEDALELCPHIGKPVLLISGSEDKMTPIEGAAKLDEVLAISKLHTIEKAGHMMMQESPEEFNKALSDMMQHF